MNSRHISQVELSAYLDNAAEEPLAIARHLAECSECAHQYHTLRDLSGALHDLPAPEVRPEFLSRVMAHVRETEMEPAPSQWFKWLYITHKQKLGLIAAGGCLVAALAVVFWATPQQTTQPPNASNTAMIAPMETDSESAMAEMPMHEAASEVVEDTSPVSVDEIVLALSNADWFETPEGAMESRMDSNAESSEEYNAEVEEIIFDFLQEGSMS